MISSSFDFREFSESVKNLNDTGVIYLADKEALEAERLIYQNKKPISECDEQKIRDYAKALKTLIEYIRYEVKPIGRYNTNNELLSELYQKILHN